MFRRRSVSETLVMTGAAGRLGTMLRGALATPAAEIRLSDIRTVAPVMAGERFVKADLTSARAMRKLCKGASVVLHLGGATEELDWKQLTRANIEGLTTLLEAAKAAGVRRFVYASSMHVLGMHPGDRPIDEATPVAPNTRYGATKAFGEAACRLFAERDGMAVTVLRIGHVTTAIDSAPPARGISANDFAAIVRLALDEQRAGFRIFHAVAPHPRQRVSDGRLERDHGFTFRDRATPPLGMPLLERRFG
jgi:uronate dehydrogenase